MRLEVHKPTLIGEIDFEVHFVIESLSHFHNIAATCKMRDSYVRRTEERNFHYDLSRDSCFVLLRLHTTLPFTRSSHKVRERQAERIVGTAGVHGAHNGRKHARRFSFCVVLLNSTTYCSPLPRDLVEVRLGEKFKRLSCGLYGRLTADYQNEKLCPFRFI